MTDTRRKNRIRDLISDLVRIESENPPGNEGPCAEYIEEWFTDRDIESTTVRIPYESRPQVVGRVGSGSPRVVLNGHMDVVPAGDRDEWTSPPFDPVVREGRIHGRGTVDMKAGLAIAMIAAATLKEPIDGGELPGSLLVHAAVGEESADPGTKTLLEEGYDGDYGVVLEPTGLRTATSVKGCAYYDFEVTGEPAHAGRPNDGANAIGRAMGLLERVREYDQTVRERTDRLVGSDYATLTLLDAGTKKNIVPGHASISMDRRFGPTGSIDEIDREIDQLVNEVEREIGTQNAISWQRTKTYESASAPAQGLLVDSFRHHTTKVADVPADEYGLSIATDMRNFVNDADMEAITWGPGNVSEAHSYNESIDLNETVAGATILERAVKNVLRNG
ncbi:M20 family metallopeptidase [Halococcus sp. IIIV-5B]|uniref:M20 family metallopeptidase n=1 Tax=Halococcus sp. IIIV-5B TaxID=2321230 RepID=UPI000E767D98|nr:ArgE/DapE family deacylase [Halococcus sp. IIIV-5B]RJT07466.1 M20 family peptidase [Halococcus sp. IIIV-5B]